MKAFYNFVTFLAAVVVLGWAGWTVYSHWDVLVKKASDVTPVVKPTTATGCSCCKHCKCGKTDCKGACADGKCCLDKKCCGDCVCTEVGCCKKN